jgi:hypothetical protein
MKGLFLIIYDAVEEIRGCQINFAARFNVQNDRTASASF